MDTVPYCMLHISPEDYRLKARDISIHVHHIQLPNLPERDAYPEMHKKTLTHTTQIFVTTRFLSCSATERLSCFEWDMYAFFSYLRPQ